MLLVSRDILRLCHQVGLSFPSERCVLTIFMVKNIYVKFNTGRGRFPNCGPFYPTEAYISIGK